MPGDVPEFPDRGSVLGTIDRGTIPTMVLKVHIYPGEDGYLIAECPALPGCASQGKTRQEALTNIREAIEGWLEVQEDRANGKDHSGSVEVVEVAV